MSFLRRQESILEIIWIPADAGMTEEVNSRFCE